MDRVNFAVACGTCAAQPGEHCIWRDAEDKVIEVGMPHAKRIEAQEFLDGLNCPAS